MLAPVRTVAPTAAPVSLDEAKSHLRVDHDDDDALITSLIDAATAHLDGWSGILGRALVTQTWRQDFRNWPGCRILRLPLPDVSSATVKYFDADNAEQSVAAGMVTILADARGSYIRFSDAFVYPGLHDDRDDRVQVTFSAGYGDATDVPAPIRTAILLHVAHLYSNRGAVAAVDALTLRPMAAEALIAPYRMVGV